jgi:Uma2 family endonuclease
MKVYYKVSDDTVVRSDVVVVCDEINESYLTKAPEIIVEVISKSTAKRDEKYKFELYQEEGVKYYTIVYPNESIAKLYRLQDGRYIKDGDFDKQIYDFENTTCKVSLNFDKVFSKYRK